MQYYSIIFGYSANEGKVEFHIYMNQQQESDRFIHRVINYYMINYIRVQPLNGADHDRSEVYHHIYIVQDLYMIYMLF